MLEQPTDNVWTCSCTRDEPGREIAHNNINYSSVLEIVKVKVTLRLTVSQSVCLGVKPKSGTFDNRYFFFFFFSNLLSSFWGALSDERSGLSCVSLCH
jgi:hypothetical protein